MAAASTSGAAPPAPGEMPPRLSVCFAQRPLGVRPGNLKAEEATSGTCVLCCTAVVAQSCEYLRPIILLSSRRPSNLLNIKYERHQLLYPDFDLTLKIFWGRALYGGDTL